MEFAIPTIIEHTVEYKTHFWMEGSHYTDSWHLIIIEEGSFKYDILGDSSIATAYNAVLFPINVEFNRKVLSELKIHYFGLNFNKDDDWLKSHGQFLYGKLNVNEEIIKEVCAFCGKFHGNEYLPLKDGLIKNLWSFALIPVLEKETEPGRIIANNSVAEAVEYMRHNLKEKISIEELAKNLGYTHIQFTRLFTKEIGMPPIVYLNELRLHKVKRLLGETDMSIGDIAMESGFENQFYLHNRFKKLYGMAPSVYRKHTRGIQ